MRPIQIAAAMFAVGMLLAACGESGGTTASPSESASADASASDDGAAGVSAQHSFDGAWELVSGTGPDGELTLVDGWPATLNVDGTELGGAVCNGYGATLSRDGDNVSIQIGGMDAAACQDDVMALEAAFHEALSTVASIGRDSGQLVLTGADVELRFAEIPPVPTGDLVGTTWVLESLAEGDAVTSVSGEPATLIFHDDGTVTGSTGCRELTGKYIEYAGEVQLPEFGLTGECSEDLQDQDGHIVSVLEGFRATVEGDTLVVTSDGGIGLVYRAE